MHAWVTGLATRAPSSSIGNYLRAMPDAIKENTVTERMLEYSDVIVFDFLVDGKRFDLPILIHTTLDHDRLGNHNWKLSADNRLLVWDSGLAWNFGPIKRL